MKNTNNHLTVEDVKDMIETADEEQEFSPQELVEMFSAVRQPDQKDWNDGVFSLICAGVY